MVGHLIQKKVKHLYSYIYITNFITEFCLTKGLHSCELILSLSALMVWCRL